MDYTAASYLKVHVSGLREEVVVPRKTPKLTQGKDANTETTLGGIQPHNPLAVKQKC